MIVRRCGYCRLQALFVCHTSVSGVCTVEVSDRSSIQWYEAPIGGQRVESWIRHG